MIKLSAWHRSDRIPSSAVVWRGRTVEADALAHRFAAFCTADQIADAQAAALAILEVQS